jgi:hypothetical protein
VPIFITTWTRESGFIQSDAEGQRSRQKIKLETGHGTLIPGTVLGLVTASGYYKPATATGSDGAQVAVAILNDTIDTSLGIEGFEDGFFYAAGILRDAEVRADDLTYDTSVIDERAKWAELAAAGIIVRRS